MDSGVYLVLFRVPRVQAMTIGKLGRFTFRAGIYGYVGSAQRNLGARLERHARRRKPLRWQIDYLSVRARFLGALVIAGPRDLECKLAAVLSKGHRLAVPRFGASDCRCPGHLFLLAAEPDSAILEACNFD